MAESVRLTSEQVAIPHPVRLPDLDDLREFAADLGVAQGTLQTVPRDLAQAGRSGRAGANCTRTPAAGTPNCGTSPAGRPSFGYPVRGGYVTNRIWEDGRVLAAAVWAGAEDPSVETETWTRSPTSIRMGGRCRPTAGAVASRGRRGCGWRPGCTPDVWSSREVGA